MNEVFIALVKQPDEGWEKIKISPQKDNWTRQTAHALGKEFALFLWNAADAHFLDGLLEEMNRLNE